MANPVDDKQLRKLMEKEKAAKEHDDLRLAEKQHREILKEIERERRINDRYEAQAQRDAGRKKWMQEKGAVAADVAAAKQREREQGKYQRMQLRYQRSDARRAGRVMKGAPTVAGTILSSTVACTLLIAIVVAVGPLIDYFSNMMLMQNGNPYAAPVAELFPWIYIFIFASFAVYMIVIWRAVISQVGYGVFD